MLFSLRTATKCVIDCVMVKLSVNVNKIATLRNSRGKDTPSVLEVSRSILTMGVHGLTVHPRPDARHITTKDVYQLAELIKDWNAQHASSSMEFNIEGYPSAEFMKLVQEVRPTQATLVPDPPDVLTSNAGWDVVNNLELLKDVTKRLSAMGSRVSLFIDPKDFSSSALEALNKIGCERIELYTEAYADAFKTSDRESVTKTYKTVAELVHASGIAINAGHDLNSENLAYLVRQIPFLAEVSIGHAIISEALMEGLPQVIKKYLTVLNT